MRSIRLFLIPSIDSIVPFMDIYIGSSALDEVDSPQSVKR